jgi:PAS domain S-box-containing protein
MGAVPKSRTRQPPSQEDAQFLRSILESSSDCIKVLDLEGNLTFMSDGGQRIMDVSDFNEIRGCPWIGFWQGQGHEDARAALHAARAGGVGHFQGRAETMAGIPKYWDVRVTPILGRDGKPAQILSVSRDITASRLAEQALWEARSLNDLILKSSSDCIVVLDLEAHTQFVSPGGIDAMEISDVDSILGLSWLRVWQGPHKDAATHAVESARAGGVGRFQGFCPTHKGTPKWWDVVITALPGLNGEPDRLVSIGRDITEQVRDHEARASAEKRLREMNETLEQRVEERTAERDRLWNASQDILTLVDANGALLAVNPAWTRILGWDAEEVVGRNHLDMAHPDDRRDAELTLNQAIDQRTPIVTLRCRHKDGGWRWISWSASFASGLVYASGRDVTAEREAAETLSATQEALRQSQKMEAVGQLTGGLAHDFNNLLAGVTGSLELIDARLGAGRFGDVGPYVAAGQASARRAAALTQRLLAFSRRQTLDPKPTDVNRLISGMEDLVRRTVGPSIQLEVVGAAGLWITRIDGSQLENALLNLCINARDAMPAGGRITIETANRWIDDVAAQTHELTPGQFLSICVTDTGTGMEPQVAERVFEPFFTTKPTGEGTGLGLSMVYGFVRQSGGQVRVYSEVGHGTTICLYLPRFSGELEDLKEAEATEARDEGHGETVLVIDDEPTVRMLMIDVLHDAGYATLQAGDGPSAMKILQSRARVDLLITDVGLPGGMNGRQVADAARVTRPALKVLFVTGYAENAVVGNGLLVPGMRVLTKPFVMTSLAGKVREMMEA